MEDSFVAPDGRKRTLWPDVYTALAAAKRAYSAPTRAGRKKRGWIFRGQANAEWPLIPSLHRPPNDQGTITKRVSYANQFFEHFKHYFPAVGVTDVDEAKCLAVAQHYGFCTNYLDFTWDIDVAAYFATASNRDFDIGIIYMYNLSEYEEMFEFSKHIGDREDANELSVKGWGPMPPLRLEEFTDILRITAQEGLFAQIPRGSENTILRQCIDRIYFRQHSGLVYKGQMQTNADSLLDESSFDSAETYRCYIRMVQEQLPGVLDRDPSVTEGRLFPFDDPISYYVLVWRLFNPDPLVPTGRNDTHLQDGDDITLNGLLPSRLWLGQLADLLQFLRGRSALFVLPDLSFLSSLIRSVRLVLFGEQPNIVGLNHYKGDTKILEMDKYLHNYRLLYDELQQACRQKGVVVVVIGAGSIPTAHLDFVQHTSAASAHQRQTVLFVTAGQNMYHNRNLPASFGAGRILWFK